MDRLGLSSADWQKYVAGILGTHERRIHVEVLDLEGRLLRSLSPVILDGQVMVDTTRGKDQPSRILDFRIVDEARALNFEPDSPAGAPLHRSRMLRIIDSRRIPALEDWVDATVFTGPIWNFNRNGAEVQLVAHGKEKLAMGARWSPREFKKKSQKTDAIRTLARDTGERHLQIPDLKQTFPAKLTVARLDHAWPKMKSVSESLDGGGRNLFYNGAGWLKMPPWSTLPCYTFNHALLSEVEIKRTVDGLVNVVEVFGGNPRGPKKRVKSGPVALPVDHPLSPQKLGRNGVPLRLVRHIKNSHFKTKKACLARAHQIRDDAAKLVVDFGFESLPCRSSRKATW